MAQTLNKHINYPNTPKRMAKRLTPKLFRAMALILLFGAAIGHAQTISTDQPTPEQDRILMDSVQKQTIKYFWDFAHPTSGLARERSNVAYDYGNEVVTTGGSGMGFMALIVGVDRGWLKREDVVAHLLKSVKFLAKADHYHGIFPHWLNGETGKTIPLSLIHI